MYMNVCSRAYDDEFAIGFHQVDSVEFRNERKEQRKCKFYQKLYCKHTHTHRPMISPK